MTAQKREKTRLPFSKTVSEADLTHCSVDTYPCNGLCAELHRKTEGTHKQPSSVLCTCLMEAPKRFNKKKKKQQRRPKPRDDDDE